MSEDKVVESIKEVAKNVLPENAKLLLYGSRARGGTIVKAAIGMCLSFWIRQR